MIGLTFVVAGTSGLFLPRRRREGVLWSLLVGTGVGVIVHAWWTASTIAGYTGPPGRRPVDPSQDAFGSLVTGLAVLVSGATALAVVVMSPRWRD